LKIFSKAKQSAVRVLLQKKRKIKNHSVLLECSKKMSHANNNNNNNNENVQVATTDLLSSMSNVVNNNNTKQTTTSTQGSRVKLELEQLRQQQLAKSRRDKLKDCTYFFFGYCS
jgi:hypothetical protein